MTGERDDRIPEILERVDLDALVIRHGGIEVRRVRGRTVFRCPHPSHEDHHPSFDTHSSGGGPRRWACRSQCSRSGDAIDLLVWLDGCNKADAIERLAAEVGLSREPKNLGTRSARSGRSTSPGEVDSGEVEADVVDRNMASPESREPTARAAAERDLLRRWCGQRGWGPWVIDRLGLSIVTDARGGKRVRFPYRLDGYGVPYWQDRALGEAANLRWLSPRDRRPLPYEADRLRLAHDRGSVVVVEGVTDVAALVDVYTGPAVVGIPGVSCWKTTWAASFRGLAVLVVTDNDPAGERLRHQLSADLKHVARTVHHAWVPGEHNDIAAWRLAVSDPERFDNEFMRSVEAARPTWQLRGTA